MWRMNLDRFKGREGIEDIYKANRKSDVKGFLLNRLDDSFDGIEKIYAKFNRYASIGKSLPKGSDWVLDNFYLIQVIYKGLREDIKKEKKIILNVVESGALKGLPRIYVLATELVINSTGNITEDNIIEFINHFQIEKVLSLEEIARLSDFLILSSMEYVERVALKLMDICRAWEKLDEIELSKDENIEQILEDIYDMNPTDVERLTRRIRKHREDFKLIIKNIDKKLEHSNRSIEDILEREYTLQSKNNISLGYGITSLRGISSFNWKNIFESICIVEKVLKQDPLGIYGKMDSSSKNYYRNEVKKLANRFNIQEILVAEKILELAREEWDKGSRDKRAHVGYYLLDNGRKKLFQAFEGAQYNNSIYLKKYSYYYGPIVLISLFFTYLLGTYAYTEGNIYWGILAFIVMFIPVMSIVVNLSNYIYSKKFTPKLIPKMDYEDEIPRECATFVVIPTLLPDERRVEELIRSLEIHYLSNRMDNIYFGLVGDFKDGDKRAAEGDEKIIRKGLEMVKELNKKYSQGEDIFYFFHRGRTYSKTQENWMGWERKRGALVEFNNLLSGEGDTSFNVISGDISSLQGNIKYIITLDADTKLPIDGARKLIGAISHPLNKAIVDEERNVVVEGYGLIQPRIAVDIESSNKSLFTRIFAGAGGMDPYSTAVSDIYQDLFGEGIFTGKGIYDLEVFRRCLNKAIPENAVLSHDLLEGSYIRVGLATDIQLIDGYPEKYSSYIMRQHRWVRGDWQLIRWLVGEYGRDISSLSKWKIVDNMRRSLLASLLFITTFLGIVFFPGNMFIWLGIVFTGLLLPIITMAIEFLLYRRHRIQRMKLNGNVILGYRTYIYQGILVFIFLPHKAIMMLDAVIRTLYRVFVSKKNLLEWTTAFDMEKQLDNSFLSYCIMMKANIISSILLVAFTYIFRPDHILIGGIAALLWLLGPVTAYEISKADEEIFEIDNEDLELLIDVGKKTWQYHRTFTDASNNYLPPDNFQEYPYNGVANRTSPTNIGLYLLSILSARDLQFIDTSEMVDLVDLTIGTIEKMEKWQGHIYNWYDTKTLEPLKPIFVSTVDSGNFISYLIVLREGLREYLKSILDERSNTRLVPKMEALISRITSIIDAINFQPLYDCEKDLFYIGFNVEEDREVDVHYDLLASEARTASYIAISRGEVPLEHWKRLGRSLIMENNRIGLSSWSGTMFEYMMPSLTLKNYRNTLLDESYNTSIQLQKDYGNRHDVPWGISESGFFAFDNQLNYQYRAFGIPVLGFQRGLKDELVISPYSTFLALKFDHDGVLKNIQRLKDEGLEGEYGFYEAIDYTRNRLPSHLDKGIVKSYMSHHQGMIFAAINNFINEDILVDRFHRDPQMKCGEFLLQERIPQGPIISKKGEDLEEVPAVQNGKGGAFRRIYFKEDLSDIKAHLLSSGTYTTMINNRGEGFSKVDNIFINRWRRDHMSSPYGQFIYIKDIIDGDLWSATYAPTYREADSYKVEFSTYKANFTRSDGDIETDMDIFLLPEELGEIRRVRLINNGNEERLIETISYFETVGETLDSDLAHPAFNNLFVRTRVYEEQEGLLSHRRARNDGVEDNWILHMVKCFDDAEEGFRYETNRKNFIGRGNSLKDPEGIDRGLTNTTGVVIDPIMSIGKKVRIDPGKKVDIYYITAFTHEEEEALRILSKYHSMDDIRMAIDLAKTKSQTEIGYLNLNHSNMAYYEELIPYLFYLDENTKLKYGDVLHKNRKGREGLWAHGISGDNPIVLFTIESMEGIGNLVKIIGAHEYWSYKGLKVDLVILNEDDSIYHQPLFENIREIVYERQGNVMDASGGIFIQNKNTLSEEERALLYKWAILIIEGEEGFPHHGDSREYVPYRQHSRPLMKYSDKEIELVLDYFNSYGGFTKDGREYVIRLSKDINTPLPWVNVIANREFGFIITELGAGFTWAQNSRENKLTPWYNDPVVDNMGEIIYMMDEDTGEIWNITPGPIRGKWDYIVTHGLGYSKFYSYSKGMEQELVMFASIDDNVKINLINIKNDTDMDRNIGLYYYIRPVLGVTDEETQFLLETDIQEEVFIVKNSTNSEFKDSILFMGASEQIKSYTGDRKEFLGSIPDYKSPEGIRRESLSNTVGIGYNPCSVINIQVTIPAGRQKDIVFLLGEGNTVEECKILVDNYKDIAASKAALERVEEFWSGKLSTIQIETPDNSMNYMMNSWLMYQTIACRIWGRAGFYQVGGAFGARDQMQDAINAIYHMPEKARKQIIRNCRHQYREGDIQHWWHPVPGSDIHKGIRSRYSDDLLWLPLGVAKYVSVTGDESILEEKVPFIESPILRDDERERYEVPKLSKDVGTVYEHCIRAIERSLALGERGLPLMGGGDWNDGMNKVGHKGSGESVWMGWFLATVLKDFIPICDKMKDFERSNRYKQHISKLKEGLEHNGWDGEWYRRAYFDNGTPIGSKENSECTIDSITQSWSVISTLGDKVRAKMALESAEKYLVNRKDGIIALLTPPFDDVDLDPGYIKSYVPGIRENGGQYTHAAAWLIKAFAMLGHGDKAYDLFRMINPINHTRSSIECAKYGVEPYVVAADVYTNPQHMGRGGWTWYTGSSGWLYRVGLEDILGFSIEENKILLDPCIPRDWSGFKIKYRYKNTSYEIEVKNPDGVCKGISSIYMDGERVDNGYVELVDDGADHLITVEMGE